MRRKVGLQTRARRSALRLSANDERRRERTACRPAACGSTERGGHYFLHEQDEAQPHDDDEEQAQDEFCVLTAQRGSRMCSTRKTCARAAGHGVFWWKSEERKGEEEALEAPALMPGWRGRRGLSAMLIRPCQNQLRGHKCGEGSSQSRRTSPPLLGRVGQGPKTKEMLVQAVQRSGVRVGRPVCDP